MSAYAPVNFRHFTLGEPDEPVGTLQAKSTGGWSLNYTPGVMNTSEYVVRRLTPLECERLQGFPDGHTDLTGEDAIAILERMPQYAVADEDGKKKLERKVRKWCRECPDGPRYKSIGNSFATPVVRFLGERVQMVDSLSSSIEGDEFEI